MSSNSFNYDSYNEYNDIDAIVPGEILKNEELFLEDKLKIMAYDEKKDYTLTIKEQMKIILGKQTEKNMKFQKEIISIMISKKKTN